MTAAPLYLEIHEIKRFLVFNNWAGLQRIPFHTLYWISFNISSSVLQNYIMKSTQQKPPIR